MKTIIVRENEATQVRWPRIVPKYTGNPVYNTLSELMGIYVEVISNGG